MNKRLIIMLLILCVIALPGCSKNTSEKTNDSKKKEVEKTANTNSGNDIKDVDKYLYEVSNLITEDVWNNGLCNLCHYVETGTDSVGNKMDVSTQIENLEVTFKKLDEINSKIHTIDNDKYKTTLELWDILYNECKKLYNSFPKELKVTGKEVDSSKFDDASTKFNNEVYKDFSFE